MISGSVVYNMQEKHALIKIDNLKKTYQIGAMSLDALKGVSFEIEESKLVVIVGPSGSGKTTLLNILGGMDMATSGTFSIDDMTVSSMTKNELTLYRRFDVGFVFQFYNLMPNLTAHENIELATEICKDAKDAEDMLARVGLADKGKYFPAQLSGGEQQRVSIARALAKNPKLLLCDEPTGALDYVTGKHILKLLSDLARIDKKTVIIVTHNSALVEMADVVIHIKSGEVLKTEINEYPKNIEEIEW